jgi:hypothetical protein
MLTNNSKKNVGGTSEKVESNIFSEQMLTTSMKWPNIY